MVYGVSPKGYSVPVTLHLQIPVQILGLGGSNLSFIALVFAFLDWSP